MSTNFARSLTAAVVSIVFLISHATAHEVRPALLSITQTSLHSYRAIWKQPVIGEFALHLVPHASNGWLDQSPSAESITSTFLIRAWDISAAVDASLEGQSIWVEGLNNTITDTLIRVTLLNGVSASWILTPQHPDVKIKLQLHRGIAIPAYLRLGVMHILTGVDHLMFVFALFLLIGVRPSLVKAITAFTVAHSFTLTFSVWGWIHLAPPIVEALVALSIVFVARELLRENPRSITKCNPWMIAFVFGLLHGMAFAGALAEVGLPEHEISLCLFLFNCGVEIGQLAFLSVVVVGTLAIRRISSRFSKSMTAVRQRVPPYAIGCAAAFWFIQRVLIAFA